MTHATSVALLNAQVVGNSYRYMVELASNELDFEGVPESYTTVDVMVAEPNKAAILELLAEKGLLKNWGMVSYWIPEDCAEF